jgi:hypothetical protein
MFIVSYPHKISKIIDYNLVDQIPILNVKCLGYYTDLVKVCFFSHTNFSQFYWCNANPLFLAHKLQIYPGGANWSMPMTFAGLDINVCPIPVKTDVGQVDLVLRLSDGTSEKIGFPNVPVRRTNLFPLV